MNVASDSIRSRLKRADVTPMRAWVKQRVQLRLARAGYLVTKIDDDGLRYFEVSHDSDVPLPAGAEETLRQDNPRLTELREAYNALDYPSAVPTQWNDTFLSKNLSLAWFRGDNAYVWQLRLFTSSARTRNYLAMLDVASRDKLGLMGKLKEDGLFGAFTFLFGDREPVSRDLLDSINEISYLNELTGLADLEAPTVLDIGAGYGRLAHRMSEALPNLAAYDCTDGVAVSTFLCEYYTGFRKLPDTVRVVPLSEIEKLRDSYTVAVNVHSFSEQSRASIRWWLERISERDIEWLLIVPNTEGELLSTEVGGDREDFLPDVLAAGYVLEDNRPVYQSDELREMIGVSDEYFLFRKAAKA
jgi:hypothetical protein